MSTYKVKLFPLDKLPVGPMGVVEPLCNSCQTKDCSNPIEPTTLTIFGKQQQWKVYRKNINNPSIVLQCVGYTKD